MKKRLIAGMGLSGCAVAHHLMQRGEAFDAFDDKPRESLHLDIRDLPERHFQSHAQLNAEDYSEIVVSPGLALKHPLLVWARENHLPILSEIEFAFRRIKGKVVGITGSNGKSTTASLTHHLLAGNGIRSKLCGNIGEPFIAHIDDDPDTVYVVEVSSFQLEHVRDFRPFIAILLNISPDHLDRHGSLEAYEDAKLRIFAAQQSNDLAIFPETYADRVPGQGQRLPLPDLMEMHREFPESEGFRLDPTILPILGRHNQVNVFFASIVARRLGLTQGQVEQVLPSFVGLEHRMEVLGELEGRTWINDSKATNPDSTRAALSAMHGDYVLILGGSTKGDESYKFDFKGNPPRKILAYGETGPRIAAHLAEYEPILVHDFFEACALARRHSQAGDTILLAPACASFDQFENFMARGRAFKRLFHELKEQTQRKEVVS